MGQGSEGLLHLNLWVVPWAGGSVSRDTSQMIANTKPFGLWRLEDSGKSGLKTHSNGNRGFGVFNMFFSDDRGHK